MTHDPLGPRVSVESVHIILGVEHDGSGEPAVLLVTHSEAFASWAMDLLETAGTPLKLIKSSFPIVDPKLPDLLSTIRGWEPTYRNTGVPLKPLKPDPYP